MSYVKNYNVGQTKLDLPYANYIHELPLLSFGDVQHTINLSLVFNNARKAAGDNSFHIANGFKLNMQKKLIISGDSISYQEESGKIINLTAFGDVYTFNDDSQRILRRTEMLVAPPIGGGGSIIGGSIIGGSITPTITEYEYVVEYPDYSKEEYNSNGYITGVYDKYGTKFLSYSYDGTKLTDITYRNTKNIELKYDSSNRLSKIIYGGKELVFNCANNPITITQRSVTNAQNTDASYSLDCSGQSLTVIASGNEGNITHTYKKVCEMNTNSKKITVSDIVGTNTVNFTTYEFVDGTFGYNVAAKYIDVINQFGVRTRLQYSNEHKLLYSYEYSDPDDTDDQNPNKMFVDNRYTGSVNVYRADGSLNNTQGKDSYSLQEVVKEWGVDLSEHLDQGGYYWLTGWVKGQDDTNTCTISISDTNIPVDCIPGIWTYFSAKLNNQFAHLTVATGTDIYNPYDAKDLRVSYVPCESVKCGLYDGTGEEIDSIVYNSTVIPLASASMHYRSGNTMAPIIKVSAADVIKYKLNKLKNKNTTEIYYNKCKSVRTGASGLFVLYNGQYIDVKDLEVRKKIISGTKEYTTVLTNNTTNVFVENLVNNISAGTQKLNLNLDVMESTSEGINTYYEYVSSTCGLISKQTTAPVGVNTNNSANANVVIVRQYNYDSTNPTKITSIVDEFGNTIEYTTDDTWGVVTAVTLPDGTVITDNYDDDKCALVSRQFSNATNPRNTTFSYTNGNLAGVSHTDNTDSIAFTFTHDKDKLVNIKKGTNMIEEHEHTDTTLDSYYPSKASSLHSVLSDFDKYGRLTKIDGVVENVYEVIPQFDDNGNLSTNSANGSAVLAKSKDLTNNQTTEYHYNLENGIFEGVLIRDSNGNPIKAEGYKYDNANRLTQNVCFWDGNAGKVISGQIAYVKEDTDPLVDGKIKEFSYIVGETSDLFGNPLAKSTNSYEDPHGRLTKKSYLIGNKTFTKTIEYDKTRVKKVTDSAGGVTEYQYDAMGRITKAGDMEYTYDKYGQLTEEKDVSLDKTIQYVYNGIGNIKSVSTTYSSGTPSTQTFTYGDTANPDRLTAFGSKAITYNAMGCPTSYDGKNFMWYDGKLSSVSKGSGLGRAVIAPRENYFYTYNAKGQRTHKDYSYLPVDLSATYYYTRSINTEYAYDNAGRLIREHRTYTYSNNSSYSLEFIFLYDESGMVGVQFKDGDAAAKVYYYQKNLQGDVVAIYDTAGAVQAKYSYDAFGNCSITNSTNTHLANYNPIRYRGYYFDDETGWYFLNARYYSPEWRRFISPDDTAYLDPESVNGLNLYCYCNNDPVNYADPSGYSPKWLQGLATGLAIAGAILVAGAVTVLTCGVGALAGTMLGAVIYGAAQGIAIGATIGVLGGGIVGGVVSDWSTEGILIGIGLGLGVGAIVGGIIGGFAGASSFTANSVYISQYGGDTKQVLSAYKGNPKLKVLNKDTTAFRTWGGESGKFGHWISPKNYGSAARSKLSLPPWNTAENTSQFLISKGSVVLSGRAAPLFGQAGGGIQWWIGLL